MKLSIKLRKQEYKSVLSMKLNKIAYAQEVSVGR